MSYISSTSKEKHAKPRLCAGAKMFGEALRQIRTSRNVKPSTNSSIRSNDGSLENKASLNLPDNLEIIIEVTSDPLDQQKATNRKITYGAKSENGLHPQHSITPNVSLDSVPKSIDRLHQTFDTEYPSSNKEIELQVSRLNELSLLDKNYHRCENDSNFTFETEVKSEEENRQETCFISYQSKQSFQIDKNNNDGGRSIFWEKGSNTDSSNSVFNEKENNDKIDFFRKNLNNSNKSISMFRENESNKDTFSSDESCSSQRPSSNAYECNKIFKEDSPVSKNHTLSLNELSTPKSLSIEREELAKPGVKRVSVNKSKYFVPQNFLGKIYDFPVHHSKDTSHLLSTQNVSKNSVIKNSSQPTILPKHFYKNDVSEGNSDLSNNHKCSTGKAPTTNQVFNYRKEIELEELSDKTVGKNSNSVASKGHHVLLSEIFGPPQKFNNIYLEKSVNSFQDNLKCKQDIIPKDIVTVNNKYCNTMSDQLLSNNNKKEKVSLPQKKDFCSPYSVPLCFRNHSFEKYTADSTKGSVQHFENDASHKIKPTTLKSYSSPSNEIIYPDSQNSETAGTISKSSLRQLNSSSLECLDQKCPNTIHSKDVHQISDSEIDCDKIMYKQTQPLSKCDTYYSCATKCAPLYVSHSFTDKQVPLSSVRNESACIFNLKDKDLKISKDFDSSTASHSSLHKYVSLSSDCRIRNQEAVGTKQIFTSTRSLLSSKEPQHCDVYYSSATKYTPNYTMNKESAGALNSKQMTAQVENSSHSFLDKKLSLSSVMNECAFNSKHRAMKVNEDSDSSTSSRSSSQKYVPLSSVMNESVCMNSKQSAMKVNNDSDSSTSSRSSLHKYVPFSSDNIMMNKKVAGTKQITVKNASSQPLLFCGFGEEPQHLSDAASDSSSSGHDLQICDNSYGKLTTDTISFQEYMKQEDFAIKCNTDFVVPSKFSYDSNGYLPLSSSVLEVVPDLLIGTCLVDPSD